MTQDKIKAIAIEKLKSILSGTGTIGADIETKAGANGETEVIVKEKTGTLQVDPKTIDQQAEILASVLFSVLSEITFEVSVEGTVSGSLVKAKGVGSLI